MGITLGKKQLLSLIHILMAKTTMANAEAVQQGMLHSAKKVTGPIKKRPQKKEDPACLLYTSYRGFRVNDFFEDIFLSFEMHKAKPEKDIYEQMMKEANILPEETFL